MPGGSHERCIQSPRDFVLLRLHLFFVFITASLGITYWAAKRTKTTAHFYAAGGGITGFQNGLALAGDYMSAASFLGIAGLVAMNGFDGLIYSTGWLVGWPIILFLIAEPLRNLGKYTFADVVAYRLRQTPVRIAAVLRPTGPRAGHQGRHRRVGRRFPRPCADVRDGRPAAYPDAVLHRAGRDPGRTPPRSPAGGVL